MLEKIKRLLGLEGADKDDLLNDIIDIVKKRLSMRLGVDEVPAELEYIVIEVSITRYNKIGNEGMAHYTQEGEVTIYEASMFAEYASDIAEWKEKQGDGPGQRGGFRFL